MMTAVLTNSRVVPAEERDAWWRNRRRTLQHELVMASDRNGMPTLCVPPGLLASDGEEERLAEGSTTTNRRGL